VIMKWNGGIRMTDLKERDRGLKSIFNLFARSSIKKLMVLYLIMTLVEVFLFVYWVSGMRKVNVILSLSELDIWSYIRLFYGIAYLATVFILVKSTSEKGSNSVYTLRRLSSSEKDIFIAQTLYNVGVFVILWAVQLVVILGLMVYYKSVAPIDINLGLSIFEAFHLNWSINSFLPLSDFFLYFVRIYSIIGLGMVIAGRAYKERRGRWDALLSPYLTILFFLNTSFLNKIVGIVFMLMMTVLIYQVINMVFYNSEEEMA